jgi:hypothetical protein
MVDRASSLSGVTTAPITQIDNGVVKKRGNQININSSLKSSESTQPGVGWGWVVSLVHNINIFRHCCHSVRNSSLIVLFRLYDWKSTATECRLTFPGFRLWVAVDFLSCYLTTRLPRVSRAIRSLSNMKLSFYQLIFSQICMVYWCSCVYLLTFLCLFVLMFVYLQASNERNYHIFYQLCAVRDIPEMKHLHLS